MVEHVAFALQGALVGDALGVPFEFKRPEEIPLGLVASLGVRGFTLPAVPTGWVRSHAAVPFGCWSDDGAQLLCLLESLHEKQGLDEEDFVDRLLAWRHAGRHQSGGTVFDVGLSTDRVLQRHAARRAGRVADEPEPVAQGRMDGNGSLMRNLAVAIFAIAHGADDETVADLARRQSEVTHRSVLARVTCALHALLIVRLSTQPKAPAPDALKARIDECAAKLRTLLTEEEQKALDTLFNYPRQNFLRGSGYVVDSFWSALDAFRRGRDYLDVVRRAIALGNDTDTTACIAGGLAGMAFAVPERLIAGLVWPPESARLLESLARQRASAR